MERYFTFVDKKIVMMSVFLNLIHRSNTIPVKIQAIFFFASQQVILKFIWRGKRPRILTAILKEKNKVRKLLLPNVNTYHKTSRQDSMALVREQTSRSMQQNRAPRNRSTQMYSLTFDKGAKVQQWRKDSLFNKQ